MLHKWKMIAGIFAALATVGGSGAGAVQYVTQIESSVNLLSIRVAQYQIETHHAIVDLRTAMLLSQIQHMEVIKSERGLTLVEKQYLLQLHEERSGLIKAKEALNRLKLNSVLYD